MELLAGFCSSHLKQAIVLADGVYGALTLIQLLSDYPADTKVLVEGYENGYYPTHSLPM